MNSRFLFLLLSTYMFSIGTSNAQFTEQYFHDTHSDYSDITDFFNDSSSVYYYGEALDDEQLKWSVRNIDFQGNILWSINDVELNNNYTSKINKANLLDDGYIYATEFDLPGNSNVTLNIIKIDSQNGNVIYNLPLITSSYVNTGTLRVAEIRDLTDTHFMVVYEGEKYLVVNRTTGNIDSSGLLNYGNNSSFNYVKIASDASHLYVSRYDSLAKKNINDLDNDVWRIRVSPYDLTVADLRYDSYTDDLYFFGNTEGNKGRISKLDKTTGGAIWDILINPGAAVNQRFAKTVITDSYIYTTMHHTYTGGGSYYLTVAKVDKNTGLIIWQNTISYVDGGVEEQDVLSIILDDEENLYLSGFYQESGYNQNVVKVDGGTGAKVWDLSIISENNSGGGNSSLYFSPDGNLISIADNTAEGGYLYTESWTHINKNTGEIIEKKELGGFSDMPSEVLAIKSLPNDDYIVVLREGNIFKVIRKNGAGNTVWEKRPPVNAIIQDVIIEQVEDTVYFYAYEYKSHNHAETSYINDGIRTIKMNLTDGSTMSTTGVYLASAPANLQVQDTYYDPLENRVFGIVTGNNNYFIKTSSYANGISTYNNTPSSSGNPPFYINTLPEIDGQLIHPAPNSDSILVITTLGIIPYYTGGNTNGSYYGDRISLNDGLNISPRSSLSLPNEKLFIVGVNNNNGIIKLYNPNTWSVDQEWSGFDGGGMTSVEADVDPDYAYVLSLNMDTTMVRKINVNTGVVAWETLAWTSSSGDNFIPHQMLYNPIIDKIALVGQLQNSGNGETKAFIQILESDGNILREIIKQGINPQGNLCNRVDYQQVSGDFLFTGALSRNSNVSDAFLYNMRGDAIYNSFIDGIIYWDENENGIKDTPEHGVQIGKVYKNNDVVYSNTNGEFTEILAEGETHNFTYEPAPNWELVSTPSSYTFTTPITTTESMEFGIKATSLVSNMEVFLVSEPTICNEDSRLSIMVKNTGTEIENGELIVDYPSPFSLYNTSLTPDSIIGSSMVFHLDSLLPGNTLYIDADFYNPNQEFVGVTFPFHASVLYDTAGEVDTADFSIQELILCSYDPNDKKVIPEGLGENGYTLIGEKLYYTIRFQNTGNYPARDVVVTDEIDADLDLETFQLIGTSHPLTKISQEDQLLTFEFMDIYLLDSISNEPESHGYIMYSIEHKQGISENTLIENTANIFFDLNPAIVTNTTKSEMVSSFPSTSINESKNKVDLLISPNPNNGEFQLTLDSSLELNGNYSISIYDNQGREIQNFLFQGIENKKQYYFKIETTGMYWIELMDNDLKLNLARQKLIIH